MKYLRSFYKRHRGMAALALLLLLGQVVGTLLIPALIANVVDLGILPGDMDAILRTGGQMLAVALLSAAVAAAGSWVTADLGARFGFEMRSLLLRKSQELSLHQFDEVGVSSMITRTTSDITNLQQTMGMVLQMVVPAPLIVGASIVMTAMVTPVMAVIQVGFMAALAAVAAVVLRKSNALSRSIQVRLDRINRVVREAVTGVRVIRAFGNEAYEEARSGDAYRSYADNMIRLGQVKTALVIGAETLSKITDWTDRNTCVLFGDGAGAAIFRAAEGTGDSSDTGILATKIYADGSQYDHLCSDGGVSLNQKAGFIHMDGKEVFKVAIPSLVQGVEESLKIAGININEVNWYVPHQANLRIIDSVAKKLEIDMDKVVVTVDHHGNTSAASIPLALAESFAAGKFKKGDVIAISAMGAGFTWGGMVIRI